MNRFKRLEGERDSYGVAANATAQSANGETGLARLVRLLGLLGHADHKLLHQQRHRIYSHSHTQYSAQARTLMLLISILVCKILDYCISG